MSDEPRVCFVISPIGDAGSEIRKSADILLDYIIAPVVEAHGYKAVRADVISQAGDITIQIIQMLIDADLVVADLTGHNANVLYELAVRHASRKPVIHMIEQGQSPPFDVRQFRAIPHHVNNLAIAEQSKKELSEQIKHFDNNKSLAATNPISIAVDIDLLRRSEDVTQRGYAALLSSIQNLQDDVTSLYNGLDNVVSNMFHEVEALRSSSTDKDEEPLLSTSTHTRALEVVISSFNTLAEEAFRHKDSLPRSLILKLGNLQPYLRGLVFQSPIPIGDKDILQSKVSNFFYDDRP